MMAFPQFSLFAPLRLRVNHLLSHGVRRCLIYFTGRRKGAKKKNNVRLGETLVRLSERMFILDRARFQQQAERRRSKPRPI
jgi:hypothetical protein